MGSTAAKNLKNLKYLYTTGFSIDSTDSTFLSGLEQLQEIHLLYSNLISWLFEQKQRYDRAGLKIYLSGLLLDGPDDPAIDSLSFLNEETFRCLAENSSKLADETPLSYRLYYLQINQAIELAASELQIDILNRFTDLKEIIVNRSVQNVQRFLDFLKNFDHIVELDFWCDQSQDLFDRLPEHSAVQALSIQHAVPDFRFLSRLKHLLYLNLEFSIDAESIRNVLEELKFLLLFTFRFENQDVQIKRIAHLKRFEVSLSFELGERADVADPNAVIQFISGNATEEAEG